MRLKEHNSMRTQFIDTDQLAHEHQNNKNKYGQCLREPNFKLFYLQAGGNPGVEIKVRVG